MYKYRAMNLDGASYTCGPWLAVAVAMAFSLMAGVTQAEVDTARKPLARIRPGTIVAKPAPEGWTDLILFARPRLGAGDHESAPSSAKRFVRMFNTAVAARVKKHDDGTHSLDEVAVGVSMAIDGKQVIVTPDTAAPLGGKLGIFGPKILSAAEESLNDVQQVARYETMLLFDAKALMHHDGEHVEMMVRHLIWVSKSTGKLGTAVWLTKPTESGAELAGDAFIVLPPQLVEDRVLHVDKSKFTLGVPGKEAFALERLPPGAKYAFTPELKEHAAKKDFTPQDVKALAVAFAQAVAKGPLPQVAKRDK